MSRRTAWTCDGCHMTNQTDKDDPPEDWSSVIMTAQHKGKYKDKRYHFCTNCAERFWKAVSLVAND